MINPPESPHKRNVAAMEKFAESLDNYAEMHYNRNYLSA